MKKAFSILMVLTIMCLSACGTAKQATTDSETTAENPEQKTEVSTESAEGTASEISPDFCSVEAIKAMIEEKGFLDYCQIYEESNNEAPKTDYNGEEVVMPADLTNAMIGKIGDSMTYQESSRKI